jgi:hypothetical protein
MQLRAMGPAAQPQRFFRAGLAVLLMTPVGMCAGPIEVPNGSFESPVVPFVEINIEAWTKTERPDDYDESGGFLWTQLTGIFRNAPEGDLRRIVNCDGDQAIWLFAVPGAGLLQESTPADPDAPPDGAASFFARFQPGKAYQLTVGIIGGGGGMAPGASLEIGLYYRDTASNRVTLASTTIAHDPGLFGEPKQLIDFTASVPEVDPGEPWAGRHLGISLLSTVGIDLQGGYWELDHVRLTETGSSAPRLVDPAATENGLRFVVESEPGSTVEILSAGNLATPIQQWIAAGIVTNLSGRTEFTADPSDTATRFYRAQLSP